MKVLIVFSAVLAVCLAGLVPAVPADTPEVAAAKIAHAQAVAQATVRNAGVNVLGYPGVLGLNGILGVPGVLGARGILGVPGLLGVPGVLGVDGVAGVAPDGTLLTANGVPLDTPAVAAGKVANAIAHAQAKAGLIG